MKYRLLILAAITLICVQTSSAAVKTQVIKYQAGAVQAQGFLAYDDAVSGKKPGIVVVPEWWGLDDYAKHRAQQLAQLGYVAFVADMYGDGKTTDKPDVAGQWAGALRNGDRVELRKRVQAALAQLKMDSHVDTAHTAAIGYCFGGTTVLELARSGADVKGVVSFHGDLSIASPAQAGQVKAQVLVCHGGDDTFSTPAQVEAFQKEMRDAKVNWEMNTYGGAVHSFTNPDADKHGIPGIAYNKQADERSWRDMKEFFDQILK